MQRHVRSNVTVTPECVVHKEGCPFDPSCGAVIEQWSIPARTRFAVSCKLLDTNEKEDPSYMMNTDEVRAIDFRSVSTDGILCVAIEFSALSVLTYALAALRGEKTSVVTERQLRVAKGIKCIRIRQGLLFE